MSKTFGDLKVGDKIYKVHIEFDKNNYKIEEKTIKKIKTFDESKLWKKDNIVFSFGEFDFNKSLSDIYGLEVELNKTLTFQGIEEYHQLYINSNEKPNSEYLYYAVNEKEAVYLLKEKMIRYINSLEYQKRNLDEKINKFKRRIKNFEN